MRVSSQGRFLKRNHIWFESFSNLSEIDSKNLDCDECIIHANPIPLGDNKSVQSIRQFSQITDLRHDEKEIELSYSKTIRNEIGRSKKEGTICKTYQSDELLNQISILDQFSSVYSAMYEEKGLQGQHLDMGEIIAYCRQKAFLLTSALIGDAMVVFHSYVFDQNDCRLLHSCSEFRSEDHSMRNMIGRANKYLHAEDILLFKRMGLSKYDWGGISSLDAPNGIDQFKMAFGGETMEYYNIHIPISIKAKVAGKRYLI